MIEKSKDIITPYHRCFSLLQIIDMSEVQLIYNTSFFKSLATGGNVSQALVSVVFFLDMYFSP
jgi:hypothetical protein